MNRRALMLKGMAAGAGALALPTLLEACGGSSSTTATGGNASTVSGAAGGRTTPKKGGTLRVAIPGMSTSDTLDPAEASTTSSAAICKQLYDTLTSYDTHGLLVNQLAEEIHCEAPDKWVVRLRQAHWHDGKPVTADDLIYTFQRILKPPGLYNVGEIEFIDPNNIKKLDSRTIRMQFKRPAMYFPDTMTSFNQSIVPVGFNAKEPIGSGAFKLSSYTAGQRATFEAFSDYWVPNQPYIDELSFVNFPTGTAQVNGLVGGQVDVAPDLDPTLIPVVEQGGSKFNVFVYPSSATLTWPMDCSKPPFNDVRVRQALRLAVNRKQLISQVYAGHAVIANDYFGPFDPEYNHSLPQREQDIEKAKSLLKAAGQEELAVQLTGAPILPMANRQNEVLVQQVAPAGFKVEFRQVDEATFYGPQYGTYPLSLSLWGSLSILDQAALTEAPTAPYNNTHFKDAEYEKLFEEAAAQKDDEKRKQIVHRMQEISYERGPYVVTQFHDYVTGYSAGVTGYRPYPNGEAGSDFRYREMGFKS
ncbi:MAG: ABC transporter substrate-binding protein [Actinobacteria bacterium]|nr:ABC transporter substrate-binding protein [Actinomycetota bacterium]